MRVAELRAQAVQAVLVTVAPLMPLDGGGLRAGQPITMDEGTRVVGTGTIAEVTASN